ncbi:hypothetical protein FB107DRAFT_246275 [Schizophyllum commune]
MQSHRPSLGPDVVHEIKVILMQEGVDLLVYGMQAALFIASVVAVTRQDTWSRPVIACVTALFVSSTVEVVGLVMYDLLLWPSSDYATADTSSSSLFNLNILSKVCSRLIFGEGNLWACRVVLTRIAAGVIGECAFYFNAPERGQRASTVMMETPLLLTNVVTTILMAIKYWYYVREIKRLVGDWRRSTQVERVLILLLESGTIYCSLWAVRFGLDVGVDGASTTYVAYSVVSAAYHSIAVG